MPENEFPPILEAIELGDLATVKSLCESDPKIIRKSIGPDCPEQPLHYAVWQGQPRIAKYLLGKGARVNAKADQGRTPLHYAAEYGQPEIAKLLLNHGADLEAKDDNGFTPLFTASRARESESIQVAKILEKDGANLDLNCLICLGHTKEIQALLDRDPKAVRKAKFPGYLVEDLVTLIQCEIWDKCGHTGKESACIEKVVERHYPIMERLLDLGADPDGGFGTALFYAVQIPVTSLTKMLLERGASVKKNRKKGHDLVKMAGTKELRALLKEYS